MTFERKFNKMNTVNVTISTGYLKGEKDVHKTDYLFATNSFISGMGRVLDIGATRQKITYNSSDTPEEADFKAIENDWNIVGEDLWRAVIDFDKKQKAGVLH